MTRRRDIVLVPKMHVCHSHLNVRDCRAHETPNPRFRLLINFRLNLLLELPHGSLEPIKLCFRDAFSFFRPLLFPLLIALRPFVSTLVAGVHRREFFELNPRRQHEDPIDLYDHRFFPEISPRYLQSQFPDRPGVERDRRAKRRERCSLQLNVFE